MNNTNNLITQPTHKNVTIKSFADLKYYKNNVNNNESNSPLQNQTNTTINILENKDLQWSANQVPITSTSTYSSNVKLLQNDKWLEVAAQDLVRFFFFFLNIIILIYICKYVYNVMMFMYKIAKYVK